jgi:PAS domain S-box-containing protein
MLHVPLRKEDRLLGVITVCRRERQAFTDQQIRLLESFAEQAGIAMENARLLDEQREALERQTATAEVLQVINSSPGDLAPVFDAMLEKATRLCEAKFGNLLLYDGQAFTAVADRNLPPAYAQAIAGPIRPGPNTALRRMIRTRAPVHVTDMLEDIAYAEREPLRTSTVELGGVRSMVAIPLLKEGDLIGAFTIYRREAGGFAENQIALVSAFADQAVIAIENTRLLAEQREALERQTATAEILQVINSSPGDLTPVFETILEKAHALCQVAYGSLQLYDGTNFRAVAVHSLPEPLANRLRTGYKPGPNHPVNPLLDGEDFVHVRDFAEIDDPIARSAVEAGGIRTALFVALRNDRKLFGMIVAARREVRPFAAKETALLQSFAAQAVIAIENARLIDETREALERQTATAEVLQVINSSPGDLTPVFDAMLDKATRLSEAAFGILWTYDGERFQAVAFHSVPPAYVKFLQEPQLASPASPLGRVARGEAFAHIPDLAADEYQERAGFLVRQGLSLAGFRTVLAVAMCKDASLLGAITIYRREVQPFSDKQIALLQSFAAQAVIAMENARLLGELRQRQAELARSVDELTATGDVLKIISRSSVNLETVLDTLVETVARLCRADLAYMFRQEDELYHLVAAHDLSEEARAFVVAHPIAAEDRRTVTGRAALERRTVHIADVLEDPNYSYGGQQTAGYRTLLGIPLLRDDVLVGIFNIGRTRVEPFTDKEIELATSFADQAVIAIENARLFEELRDRQAELRVTFDNMGDGVAMFDGEPRLAAWNRNFEQIIGLPEALLAERPSYGDYLRMLAERGEFGTENVEAELASRLENTVRELRLERTRADGTVIEVRRNAVPGGGFVLIYSDVTEQRRAEAAIRAARDAAEAALERQTATADILKVIASSPTDVQPVLDALVKSAVRFCGATDATISLRDGNEIVRKAHEGPLGASIGARRPLDGDSASARAIYFGHTIHYQDINALDPVEFAGAHKRADQDGYRAALAAPMIRDGVAIGNIALRKVEAGAFTTQQIALLETFAAQAVIAIENVRLFNDLREALEQQTATADILRVISQSPTDVIPVLTAVAKAALKFCGARDAQVALRDGDTWSVAAHEGPIGALRGTRRLNRQTAPGRAMVDGEVVQIGDLQSAEGDEFQEARELGARLGFRSALAAPLLRDDVPIGAISLRRPEAGLFTPNQVELLKSFAAQAVIAIENVRLFTELRDSLERLKAAQANLIQAEKMASLGQLTAGIAHEIKNPLNFVNNFAGLSSELLDELKQAVDALLAEPDEEKRAELQDTMDLLTGNLAKIIEHGRRADGIVKSMLSHSRGGTGDWQESNVNALVEEALNLAYHGARAQDKDFNVTLERDFAPEIKSIEVVPQDATRVFLNLFGNGFYATRKRHLGGADAGYRPTLTVSTRDLGEAVEVRVRDNGTGIQPEVRARLFQPFFTTKPTGEGTGLGLSISYDIVTQQHGGTIEVESEPGSFTEFTVRLPRSRRVAQSRGT